MRRFVLSTLFASALAVVGGCGDTGTTSENAIDNSIVNVEPGTQEPAAAVVPLGWTSEVRDGELTIGNPAPPISIASFVHGDPVGEFENGKVYVVEFWATWCGPCLRGMPHISSLADKYRGDVVFVGITGEGRDDDENWNLDVATETVTKFLESRQSAEKTWAEVVTYSLALDDNLKTNGDYMEAAGQSGIPTAFIVGRDGVLEWVGHPMSMDDTLAAVVDGTYDREAAYGEKESERMINDAIQNKDYDTAIAEIDKLIEKTPDNLNLLMFKMNLLNRTGKIEDLNALQAELVTKNWDDEKFLNMIAWGIADEKTGTDLELAMKSARRASEITKDTDPSILDTVARVFYEQKNLEEAIAWQKKAVAASDDEGAANDIAKSLADYEEALKERQEQAAAEKKAIKDKIAADKAAKEKAAADAKAAAEKAAADKAAADKAAADKAAADKAAADKAAADKAAADKAAADKAAADKAAADKAAADKAAAEAAKAKEAKAADDEAAKAKATEKNN